MKISIRLAQTTAVTEPQTTSEARVDADSPMNFRRQKLLEQFKTDGRISWNDLLVPEQLGIHPIRIRQQARRALPFFDVTG